MRWLHLALAAVAACPVTASYQHALWAQTEAQVQAALSLKEKATYEPMVGKSFWLKNAVSLCPKPAYTLQCEMIYPPRRLMIDGVEQQMDERAGGRIVPVGLPYCHAAVDDGRSGYVVCLELPSQSPIDPVVAAAECKRRGEPRVGMTAKQLEATCWGKPVTINRKETASGITERYIYDSDRSALLRNGVVVSIRTLHLVPAAR
jgi:hypothetical protein